MTRGTSGLYFQVSQFSNSAKPAFDWLEKKVRAVSCGRIHVTNIKILLTRGTSGPRIQTLLSLLLIGLKKLADGKSWQNSHDELQNIEFNQSSAKAPKLCKGSARSSARSSVRSSAKALPKALPKALQHLCPPSVLAGGSKGVSPLKLCSKLYSKPYTELQSSTNTQH